MPILASIPAPGAVLLIGVALLVAVIAAYLIHIIFILRQVVLNLDVILGDVVDVTEESKPIGPVANAINADLAAASRALERAVEGHHPSSTGAGVR